MFMHPEKEGDLTSWDLKIGDFGFSCFFDAWSGMHMNIGTPEFQAPELLNATF